MWEQILAAMGSGSGQRGLMGGDPWATQDPFGLNFQSQQANQGLFGNLGSPRDGGWPAAKKKDPSQDFAMKAVASGGKAGEGVPGFQDMSQFASMDKMMGGIGNLQKLSQGAQQQRQPVQPYRNDYISRLLGGM